ncbi:phage head completion protein [Mycolicibacterium phlei]|uniref:phage head completion protein n=1 Tax=Mycolicibacterium phlei TaxID=1771 RepID=UPI0002FD13C7|nr:hypothetical protein [Mycolicibacterium phlei]MBF4194668.1 hypothetical protein [Mycolicibacterium phlei]
MSFGNQTVTVVIVTGDDDVRDRYNNPQEVRTEVTITGCRFRPMTAKEKQELGDIATEPWKLTAPPVPGLLAARAIDEIRYKGTTYQIIGGVRPYTDFTEHVYKVTVVCERTIS